MIEPSDDHGVFPQSGAREMVPNPMIHPGFVTTYSRPPIVFYGAEHSFSHDSIKALKAAGYLPIKIKGMRHSQPPSVVFPEPG